MLKPHNILIARLSSIGDIILTTPLIRAVRKSYPNARITFLVKEEFSILLRYNPQINEIITFRKSGGVKELLSLRKTIKSRKFDTFIDLHNNLRTRFLRISISFPFSSTYSKQSLKRWLLVKLRLNLMKSSKPVYLKYFDAVKPLEVLYDEAGTEIFNSEESIAVVSRKLIESGINPTEPITVICPGASFSNKQWLPERFGEVAAQLINHPSGQVVFLGGPGDRDLCDYIVHNFAEKAVNMAGKLNLLESAALLKMAVVLLSNDSGMMHLAQSQGTPVVAIFGPTSMELGFFPLPQKSRIIETSVSCRPCTTKGLNHCPKHHFNCMKGIETARVLEAVRAMSHTPDHSDL